MAVCRLTSPSAEPGSTPCTPAQLGTNLREQPATDDLVVHTQGLAQLPVGLVCSRQAQGDSKFQVQADLVARPRALQQPAQPLLAARRLLGGVHCPRGVARCDALRRRLQQGVNLGLERVCLLGRGAG